MILAGFFFAAAATLASAAPAVSTVSPAPKQDKQEKQSELQDLRGQIDQLKHDLANNESHRKDAADALQQSEKAISDANRVLNDLSSQRQLTSAQLAQMEIDIGNTRNSIRDSQKRLAGLLNSRYRTRELEAWRLVLNQQDPNQTSRELTYYRYLTAAQQQLAQQLQQQLDQLNEVSDRIREKNDELQELARQKAAQKAELLNDQQEKQQVLSSLSQQINSQRNQIGKLQADEKRMTTLIARLDAIIKQQELKRAQQEAARKKAEAQRLAREEAARRKQAANAAKNKNQAQPANNVNSDTTAQVNPTPAPDTAPAQDKVTRQNTVEPDASLSGQQFAALKGRLRLPLKGDVIGRFGTQRAEGATWKGVFIRAASGLPVKAVATGRVVFADWLRGFGNMMIIDHGGGYMSIYAANESLLKRVGDTVNAGDTIATSGNSGGMGDSGVYFEIRQHGKPLDPLSWAG
ncbi:MULTISPECIES: murein hydrolase activator EnvC family protein [Silvimonas]|uniref:murein hydrolase activator EnvC family protein n=1 Tax=Silvimonas TaxID=300264 RepID=UPI0024B3226C|nr:MULTISPECIES: peptidoglycan DD-metalloendopeptidase family protein [Silvimonas]MDR3430122.1 peptidoglycan DD-metalloendopeptidase family protein [Silvimonas sp.]